MSYPIDRIQIYAIMTTMSWVYEIKQLKAYKTLEAVLTYTSYDERKLKNPVFKEISSRLNSLGYKNSPLTVKTISKVTGFSVDTVKKHLNSLVKAGLLYKISYSRKTDSYIFVTGVNGKTFLKLISEGTVKENQKLDKVFGEKRNIYLTSTFSWKTFFKTLSSLSPLPPFPSSPSSDEPSPSNEFDIDAINDLLSKIYFTLSRKRKEFVYYSNDVTEGVENKAIEAQKTFEESFANSPALALKEEEEETFRGLSSPNLEEEKTAVTSLEVNTEITESTKDKANENTQGVVELMNQNSKDGQAKNTQDYGISEELREKIFNWILEVVRMKNEGLPEAKEEYQKLNQFIRKNLREGFLPNSWERGKYVIDLDEELPDDLPMDDFVVIEGFRKKIKRLLGGQEFINKMFAKRMVELKEILVGRESLTNVSENADTSVNTLEVVNDVLADEEKKEEEGLSSLLPQIKYEENEEVILPFQKKSKLEKEIASAQSKFGLYWIGEKKNNEESMKEVNSKKEEKKEEYFSDEKVKITTIHDPRFGTITVRSYGIDEPIMPEVEDEESVSLFSEDFFEENILGIFHVGEIYGEDKPEETPQPPTPPLVEQQELKTKPEKIDLEKAKERLEKIQAKMRELTQDLFIPYEEIPFHERDLGKRIKEELYKDKEKYKDVINHIEDIIGEENYKRIASIAKGSGMFPHIIEGWKLRRKELITELADFKKKGRFPLNLKFIGKKYLWDNLPKQFKEDFVDILAIDHPIYNEYYREYFKMYIPDLTKETPYYMKNLDSFDSYDIINTKNILETYFRKNYKKYFEIAEQFAEQEKNEVIKELVYKTLMFPAVVWDKLGHAVIPSYMYLIANKYYLALMDAINLRNADDFEVLNYYRNRENKFDTYAKILIEAKEPMDIFDFRKIVKEEYGFDVDYLELIDFWYKYVELNKKENIHPETIDVVFGIHFNIGKRVEIRMLQERTKRAMEEFAKRMGKTLPLNDEDDDAELEVWGEA